MSQFRNTNKDTDNGKQYISAIIFSAPTTPTKSFLLSLPYTINSVYHGPTPSTSPNNERDFYADAREMGVFKEIESHAYSHVHAGSIVERIMKSRSLYEERQRAKGVKGVGEEAVRRREMLEKEKAEKERLLS
jgi:ethanolamine-phosphate cytidylyltransferase